MACTLAVLSDLHWPKFEGIEELFKRLADTPFDALVVTGDLVQNGNQKPEQLQFIREKLIQLAGDAIPWCAVPGNHDVGDHPGGVEYDWNTLSAGLELWRDTIGADYHHIALPELDLIALDSCLFGSHGEAEAAQWAWFECTLAATRGRAKLLFTHYPLFLNEPDEIPDLYWVMDGAARNRLIDAIMQDNFRAVVTGHIHRAFDQVWNGVRFLSAVSAYKSLDTERPVTGWQTIRVLEEGIIYTTHTL